MSQKIQWLSLTSEELKAALTELGQPSFRAKQLQKWFCLGAPADEMTNIPKSLRDILTNEDIGILHYPKIVKKQVSSIDGTVKYLFELHDLQLIESVVMKYEHGNTICVSTQAGCRMGCKFCASTLGGKVRDLTAGEILGQIISAQRDFGERISGVVMMGIGEPLDNYDNVMRFLDIVGSPDSLNIGYRHISLSSCGLVDKINRLADEKYPITLSISLHATNDSERDKIMPINSKWNIDALLCACRDYFDKTGRRISFEYTLISGENDSPEQAKKLAELIKKYFRSRPVHVNLIPLNHVDERSFRAGSRADVKTFCDTLNALGVNATVRRRLGPDIDASCGQLRHKANK
ncbi:MAG: 23S rRNA (adenine(2503)-C(2))-methyltransferase RlmN [Ruminococcaceae bacterium]|nr:23S rRNA (adenine(2503)-C(2))-methyltransferase RlmN [Oscillospiraceae bacterium]